MAAFGVDLTARSAMIPERLSTIWVQSACLQGKELMSELRVCHVLEATAGGTWRHLRELLKRLPRSIIQQSVVCAVRREPSCRAEIARWVDEGVAVALVDMVRGFGGARDLLALAELQRAVRRIRPHVLHLHSAKAGMLGRLIKADARVVYSPHCFPFVRHGAWSMPAWAMEVALARRADVLHAVSRAEAGLAIDCGLFAPSRVVVIENCVSIPEPTRPSCNGLTTFGLIGELRSQKSPKRLSAQLKRWWREMETCDF